LTLRGRGKEKTALEGGGKAFAEKKGEQPFVFRQRMTGGRKRPKEECKLYSAVLHATGRRGTWVSSKKKKRNHPLQKRKGKKEDRTDYPLKSAVAAARKKKGKITLEKKGSGPNHRKGAKGKGPTSLASLGGKRAVICTSVGIF